MKGLCGANCNSCGFKESCNGCESTNGNPYGKGCFACECIYIGGTDCLESTKKEIIREINSLQIKGMPEITELFSLCGFYVNLPYPMANGEEIKLLDDNRVYLGCQLHSTDEKEKCFGIVADRDFFVVARYGETGSNPELIAYKKR